MTRVQMMAATLPRQDPETPEMDNVIWLRPPRPKGQPKDSLECETRGCNRGFSGEDSCEICSNWENLPAG